MACVRARVCVYVCACVFVCALRVCVCLRVDVVYVCLCVVCVCISSTASWWSMPTLSFFVYVCMCVCVYVCLYVCICECVCMCVCAVRRAASIQVERANIEFYLMVHDAFVAEPNEAYPELQHPPAQVGSS